MNRSDALMRLAKMGVASINYVDVDDLRAAHDADIISEAEMTVRITARCLGLDRGEVQLLPADELAALHARVEQAMAAFWTLAKLQAH